MNSSRTHHHNYKPLRGPIQVTPQMKYFGIVLRKIVNNKLHKTLNSIQQYHSPHIRKLKYIVHLFKCKQSSALSDLLQYAYQNDKKQITKQNNTLLSLTILQKRYYTGMRVGFEKLRRQKENTKRRQRAMQILAQRFELSYEQCFKKQGFQKMQRSVLKFQKKKQGLQKLDKAYKLLQRKRMQQSFESVIRQIFTVNYAFLFKISEQNRKRFLNYESDKKSRIMKAKNDLHKFKNEIDMSKNNEQIGNLKKQVVMRVGKVKQNMKGDIIELEESQRYNENLQERILRLRQIKKNRKTLKEQANKEKVSEKVIKLYERIKHSESEDSEMSTVKQKFNNHMNFTHIKSLSQFYIRQNCQKNMIICFYEKTPIEILHLSKEYCRVRSENEVLRQFIGNIVQINLERGKNKQIMKAFEHLKEYFEKLFEIEKGGQGKFVKEPSSKSLVMKSSLKTSDGF